MNKKIIFPIAFLFSLFLMAFALAIPAYPHAFYGDITFNGAAISNGYELQTKLNEIDNAKCAIIDGRYGFGTNTCVVEDSEFNGGKVEFYLCNQKIGEAIFVDKEVTSLDFALAAAPTCAPIQVCGDATCNNGETCSSCAADCGACPVNTGGGSGGGGSGGGGGGTTKTNKTTNTTVINLSTNTAPTEKVNDTITTEETNEQTSSGITGAVVGFAKSKTGLGMLFAIILVVIVTVLIGFKKRTKTENDIQNSINLTLSENV